LEASYPRLVVALALANGSLAAAEDAVQEALVRAWAKSERGDHIESLPAWVTTVALNLSRKTVRRLIVESKAKLKIRASQSGSVAPMTGEACNGRWRVFPDGSGRRLCCATCSRWIPGRSPTSCIWTREP
jgi:predicted RNA polymerase sigma factor